MDRVVIMVTTAIAATGQDWAQLWQLAQLQQLSPSQHLIGKSSVIAVAVGQLWQLQKLLILITAVIDTAFLVNNATIAINHHKSHFSLIHL